MDVKRQVKERRKERTLLEQSPKNDKNANGEAEVTVKSVASKIRTLKAATEQDIKCHIPSAAPVLKWMIQYAAYCISRYQIQPDGKTPYEKLTGKKDKLPVVNKWTGSYVPD